MSIARLLPFLALSACAAPGAFPSLQPRPAETDRAITAPGADVAATLSEEERRSVGEDIAQARSALRAALAEIAAAEGPLAVSLTAARGTPAGSDAWAEAQLTLSRFQDARTALPGIDARLAPALLLTDALPETDPDRRALAAVRAEIAAQTERTAAIAAAAETSLDRR